ncbi:hypothetical protein TNCV_2077481, partial [Trichonephila clavipes]
VYDLGKDKFETSGRALEWHEGNCGSTGGSARGNHRTQPKVQNKCQPDRKACSAMLNYRELKRPPQLDEGAPALGVALTI